MRYPCRLLRPILVFLSLSSGSLAQPSIVTRPPDSVTATSAVLRALCYPNGTTTQVDFLFGRTLSYELGVLHAGSVSGSTTSAVVTLPTPVLEPYTTYQYRAVATHPGQPPVHGEGWSFATLRDSLTGGFIVEFDFIDNLNIRNAYPVRFGLHTSATYCLDRELGEFWLPPPPPPGGIDLRMIDPRGFDSDCLDQGVFLDLRPYVDTSQVDTYRVAFTPTNGSYPAVLSWTSLAGSYAGPVRLFDDFGGVAIDVDMKAQNAVTIALPLTQLTIIAERPRTIIALRTDSIAANLVRMRGLYNPGGQESIGWFEYGLTPSYGDSSVAANLGSGTTPVEFTGTIEGLTPGTDYYCRAVTQNSQGVFRSAGIMFQTLLSTDVSSQPSLPAVPVLTQNYPNPFNPSTTIRFSLPGTRHISITIYDLLGKQVDELLNGDRPAGEYELSWNPVGLPSGVYFCRVRAGDFIQTRKMLYLK